MKRLITGVLLVALCCAPSIAQAGIPRAPLAAVAEAPGGQFVASAPVDDSPGAAREAATPQLGQFEGGRGGFYIGGGAVVVVLLVVLLVVLVH